MNIKKAAVLLAAAAAGIGAAVYFLKDKQDREALSEEFGDDDFDMSEDLDADSPEGYERRYVSINGKGRAAASEDMSDSIKP